MTVHMNSLSGSDCTDWTVAPKASKSATAISRFSAINSLETQSWCGIKDDKRPIVIVENSGIGGLSPKLGQFPGISAVNSNHLWFKDNTHKAILVQKFMMVKGLDCEFRTCVNRHIV